MNAIFSFYDVQDILRESHCCMEETNDFNHGSFNLCHIGIMNWQKYLKPWNTLVQSLPKAAMPFGYKVNASYKKECVLETEEKRITIYGCWPAASMVLPDFTVSMGFYFDKTLIENRSMKMDKKKPKKWWDVAHTDEQKKFFNFTARSATYQWRSVDRICKKFGWTYEQFDEKINPFINMGIIVIRSGDKGPYIAYWENVQDELLENAGHQVEDDVENRSLSLDPNVI